MTSEEIRKKFLKFFESKDHAVVASSPLIPDDPSVLLTTAGMQQFKKYFTGELAAIKDFHTLNTTSVQKCFRTSDIEEVGDERHDTFFEMLGNFSFGGYFKKEAIQYAYDFVVNEMGLKIDYVTVFAGEAGHADGRASVPEDKESAQIWHSLDPKLVIKKCGRADNFWGPTGNEGPCGPTTEIYVNGIEIWNVVFNQYYCRSRHPERSEGSLDSSVSPQNDTVLDPLETPGIDTGMGLERLAMVVQNKPTVFETDLFAPIIELLPNDLPMPVKRVLADHLRASVFLIADGVRPSNKEAGYILRRLLRRVLAYQSIYDIHADLFESAARVVGEKFGARYPEVKDPRVLEVMESEKDKFETAIATGIKEIKKHKAIGAKEAFYLYESFGLPFELIKELAPEASKGLDRKEFDEKYKKHQELSRAGAEKKFGGHGLLLDTGELKAKDEEELKKVTRLHTATHLMQAALRKVLGNDVQQRGSDITAERTRFDFAFPRKMTPEEIKKVEAMVNEVVDKDLPMGFQEMAKEDAEKTGALYFFKQKYPPRVKVYYAGHSIPEAFSKEFCGGPHVTHTLEVGKFKIMKEEAVGSGVRRIRATVE